MIGDHCPRFDLPVTGAAIGIYGLWVLLNSETELLFRQAPLPAGALRGCRD